MNEMVRVLHAHRSIRRFKSDPVTDEQLGAMLQAAQMASTSSNVQAYSVIRVSDHAVRSAIKAVTGGQEHVELAPLFLVWCADLYRDQVACELNGVEMVSEGMENFMISTIDTTLAAQNAAVAAEAMGLGIVYIGGIRNDLRQVTELLQLPKLVYPVFGMCIGVPDQEPSMRPRLGPSAVLHENVYRREGIESEVQEYDVRTREYYVERTGGKKDTTWSQEMVNKFRQKPRAYMKEFLEEQGFRLT